MDNNMTLVRALLITGFTIAGLVVAFIIHVKAKSAGKAWKWFISIPAMGAVMPVILLLYWTIAPNSWDALFLRIGMSDEGQVIGHSVQQGQQAVQSFIAGQANVTISTPVPDTGVGVPPTAAPSAQSLVPQGGDGGSSQDLSGYPTNQQVINAFSYVYGANYWQEIVNAGLRGMADHRSTPFTQKEMLPDAVRNALTWPTEPTVAPTVAAADAPTPTPGPTPTPVPTATPDPEVAYRDRLQELWAVGDRSGARQYCVGNSSQACELSLANVAEAERAWQEVLDYLEDHPRPRDEDWQIGLLRLLPAQQYRSLDMGWGTWKIEVYGPGWLHGMATEIPRQFLNAIDHKSDGERWEVLPSQ